MLSQPNTIRPGQGQRFLSAEEMRAGDIISARTYMDNAQVGFDPVTGLRRHAQQRTNAASRREVMNTLLRGVRRSGSMARSISFRGLGAVDCSTFSASKMSQPQIDAMTGLLLSVLSRADAFEHLNAAGAQCWMQHVNGIAMKNLDVLPIAADVVSALRAEGLLPGNVPEQPLIFAVSTVLAAGGVKTVKRAVALAKCGAAITAVGGWAQYETLWASSPCMTKSWYENPLYLGGGAAVLIGAVWFATRKKKAG